jgi:hypothetical protein
MRDGTIWNLLPLTHIFWAIRYSFGPIAKCNISIKASTSFIRGPWISSLEGRDPGASSPNDGSGKLFARRLLVSVLVSSATVASKLSSVGSVFAIVIYFIKYTFVLSPYIL